MNSRKYYLAEGKLHWTGGAVFQLGLNQAPPLARESNFQPRTLIPDNEYPWCRVHKPGVPNGSTFQQKLSPADGITNDAQLLGRPRYLTIGRKSDLVSDRKAWPRRDDARFQPRPASPTGRPGQGGTTLAFDSDSLL